MCVCVVGGLTHTPETQPCFPHSLVVCSYKLFSLPPSAVLPSLPVISLSGDSKRAGPFVGLLQVHNQDSGGTCPQGTCWARKTNTSELLRGDPRSPLLPGTPCLELASTARWLQNVLQACGPLQNADKGTSVQPSLRVQRWWWQSMKPRGPF